MHSHPSEAAGGDPLLAEAAALEPVTDANAPSPQPPSGFAAKLWVVAGTLLIVALNLRIAVASVGPVFREAVQATAMPGVLASLLATVPSLCFGLIGPAAPRLARRFGTERTLLAVLLVLTAGCALRGVPSGFALFAGQVLACAGIGIVNVLLPSIVKRHFQHHAALMTGLYTTSFCAGAAAAAGATAPLRNAFGGSWSLALAVWAIPAAVAALVWLPQIPRTGSGAVPARIAVRGLWTDPLAWQLTFFMGMQSALAYIVFGWLVPILRDRGMNAVDAGLVLSASVVTQALACLVVPWLAARGRDQRPAAVAVTLIGVVGLMGCIYAPLSTVWFWTLVLGFGQGGSVSLALTLIVLRAPSVQVAASLSGMCQSVGYLLASAGPLVAGLLHAWTGGWNAVAAFSLGLGAVLLIAGIGAGRALHVRATEHVGAS